jgi:hypothetical protein
MFFKEICLVQLFCQVTQNVLPLENKNLFFMLVSPFFSNPLYLKSNEILLLRRIAIQLKEIIYNFT